MRQGTKDKGQETRDKKRRDEKQEGSGASSSEHASQVYCEMRTTGTMRMRRQTLFWDGNLNECCINYG